MRLILILALLFPVSALADYLLPMPPIDIKIVRVAGNHALSGSLLAKSSRKIKRYARSYGMIFNISITLIADPFREFRRRCHNESCLMSEFSSWVHKLAQREQNKLVHILIPPVTLGHARLIAGAALQCSYGVGGLSLSAAQRVNIKNEKRVTHSTVAMLHEMFHALGARHDNFDANVMNENALVFVKTKLLKLNKKSVKEILSCLN